MVNLKTIVSMYAVALVAVFVVALVAVYVVAFIVFSIHDEEVTKVINGDLVLMCEIKGKGVTQIEPEKVTGREDGYWVFVNGKAKSCYID